MSNELTTSTKENTISSREVAEMMGVRHGDLLEKIDRINENLQNGNFRSDKYWIEGTYTAGTGKQYREYQVTKRGCELIAHKTEGQKGVEFTVRYMDRFEEMEQKLQKKTPVTYIEALEQLLASEKEKERLALENKEQLQIIGELQPKADYTDEILKCPGTVTITQIAKDYGMSGTKMNKVLNELGVQFKKSNQWFIYEKYNGKGYTKSQTVQIERHGVKDCVMNTKWTQKGRLFLYELLKNEGIYPNIEKGDF